MSARPAAPRPVLSHRIEVDVPPEVAWRAITDPAWTEQYMFGLALRGDLRVGARLVFETPSGQAHMTGEVVEVAAPRRLRLSVRLLRDVDTAADLPSRITWEVEPAPEGGSVITVVHDEFVGETPTYRRLRDGWPLAVAGLRELLETGSSAGAQARWPEHVERPTDRAGSLGRDLLGPLRS